MVFLMAYGLLLASLFLWGFGTRRPLYLLPLVVALADALENLSIAALAASYAGTHSWVAWIAAAFTLWKWMLAAVTAATVGIGGMYWLFGRRAAVGH